MSGAEKGSARRHFRRAVIIAVAALVAGAAAAREKQPPAAPSAALFGVGEVAHPPATDFAKWTETLARYTRERLQEKALCEAGDCALVRWREFIETLRGQDPLRQLAAVNAYLNRVAYRTDQENYGAEDYWATPRELFARGGDCEDYAIAKYLSLRALGWPAERLRVAVVHDNARDLVHAALIAYHGGDAYVLDIEFPAVTDHRKIARYAPIFSISETGWWSYRALPPAEAAAAVAKAAERPAESKPAPRHSLHLRHKQGRPAKLAARAEPRLHAWHSPHLKHAPRRRAQPRPTFAEVLRAATDPAHAPPAPSAPSPEPEHTAEPGERLEEVFLPGAR